MIKILSVSIYMLTFIASIYFTKIAEKSIKSRKKRNFYIFSGIAVFFPCLLAAFRGISVGTDTVRYIDTYQMALKSLSWTEFWDGMQIRGLESGFSFLLYFLSRFHLPNEFMLFMTELLVVLPVYYVAIKYIQYAPAWTYMYVFYMIFYNISFNATRQSIALSFLLLAFHYLMYKKYIYGGICCIIAISFHSSAYVGILFIVIALVFMNIKVSAVRQMIIIGGLTILALTPLFFGNIVDYLQKWGILSSRQSFYRTILFGDVGGFAYRGLGKDAYFSIAIKMIILVVPIIYLFVSKLIKNNYVKSISLVVLIGCVFYASGVLAFKSIHIYRITLYAEIFMVLFFPLLYIRERHRIGVIKVRNMLYGIIPLIYWFTTYIHYNYHQTSNLFIK